MRRLLPLLLLMACTQPAPVTRTPAAPQPASEAGARVILPDAFVVHVETVADSELRAQGLMFRDHLRPDAGMLFFFPGDDVYKFWMKNTKIPLDMIFIGTDRRIVGVEHDVPPCRIDDCPSYGPNLPSRYVLELAGGVAKQHGLKAGDLLTFVGTDHVVAR